MLIARPLSALGGLAVLVLLSRLLSAVDYGVYFAMWAIVEITILSSNLGLLHAAYRFVSSSEWVDGSIHLHGPMKQLIAWRGFSLLVFSSLLLALPSIAENFFKLGSIASALVPFIALIILTEGMARYLEVIFDSMLFQGSSQFTLLSRTLIRLAGLSYLMLSGSLTLTTVIFVELTAATTGMAIGLFLLWRLHQQANKKMDKPEKEIIGIARMARFSLPAYTAQVLGVTYGPDSLKLALGSVAGASAIALFGFAYSIAAVAQRYMPANILSGIFRPIFVAVSRKPDADQLLSDLLSVSIKLNWVFVLSAFCFVYFGGNPLLAHLSGGNYPEAGTVTAWLVFGLLAIAVHLNLSMYCLAKENPWPPLLATIASMAGLPLGFLLANSYGAIGIAAAFGASELIWAVVCLLALQFSSHKALQLDWLGFLKLLGSAACVLAICTLFDTYIASFWLVPTLLAPGLFLVLILPSGAFTSQEKSWLLSVLPIQILPFSRRTKE